MKYIKKLKNLYSAIFINNKYYTIYRINLIKWSNQNEGQVSLDKNSQYKI